MKQFVATIAALLFLAVLASPAQAKVQKQNQVTQFCDTRYCGSNVTVAREAKGRNSRRAVYHASSVVGARPAGCPYRYCGCGLSIKIFGKIKPELNLAWNWVKYFPRTSPAPGMAAARRGHVMGLISQVSGNDWLVYDANSGNGLTRQHVRSIRGYTIVNPYASRMANK